MGRNTHSKKTIIEYNCLSFFPDESETKKKKEEEDIYFSNSIENRKSKTLIVFVKFPLR